MRTQQEKLAFEKCPVFLAKHILIFFRRRPVQLAKYHSLSSQVSLDF
jgi:hypothetical protein